MCLNEYFELNLLFAINEWLNNIQRGKMQSRKWKKEQVERWLGDGWI